MPSYLKGIEVYAKVNETINANNLSLGYYIYGLFYRFEADKWIMYNSFKRLTEYDTLNTFFIFNVTKDHLVYLYRSWKYLVTNYNFTIHPFQEEETYTLRVL